MKKTWLGLTLVSLLALALSLVVARPAYADHCGDDKRVVGGNYVLPDGQTLDSNLIVVGGDAIISDGARVSCTVVVFGGSLEIAGQVDEDVVAFGGNTSLENTAEVGGELVTFGGSVERAQGAVVRGGESRGFDWNRGPRVPWVPSDRIPFLNPVLSFYQSVFETFLTAAALGLLALLVVLFWPEQTAHVGAAVTTAPVAAGGLGLLTLVAVPVLIALVTLTICLVPIAFMAGLLFMAALVFGWVALGLVVGQRLAGALKAFNLSPAVAAALGTGVLTLVMRAIAEVPCVGWVPPLVLAGLGRRGAHAFRHAPIPRQHRPAASTPRTPGTAAGAWPDAAGFVSNQANRGVEMEGSVSTPRFFEELPCQSRLKSTSAKPVSSDLALSKTAAKSRSSGAISSLSMSKA
jgi:hypothetical protein